MEENDFRKEARRNGVIVSTIFNSDVKSVRKNDLISNLVKEGASVSASEANEAVDNAHDRGLIVLRNYDYDRVYYLTNAGAYEYLFNSNQELFRRIYAKFEGTGFDPTLVEEFLSKKCYRMYLDDEAIDVNGILEEYEAYAKRESNRLHLQN